MRLGLPDAGPSHAAQSLLLIAAQDLKLTPGVNFGADGASEEGTPPSGPRGGNATAGPKRRERLPPRSVWRNTKKSLGSWGGGFGGEGTEREAAGKRRREMRWPGWVKCTELLFPLTTSQGTKRLSSQFKSTPALPLSPSLYMKIVLLLDKN